MAKTSWRTCSRWSQRLTLACVACLGAVLALAACAAPAGALPERFGEEGSGAGQIESVSAVAVEQESGDVYVADQGNNRIEKFGPEGEFLLAWGWGVADGTTPALQTCTSVCFAGLSGSGAGQFARVEGLAVDNDPLSASHGDVYAIDSLNHRIEKFGPEGEFLLAFGGEGSGPGQFEQVGGRAIAVDAAGGVHVGDNERVQQFSPAGAVEGQFSAPGALLLEGLAVDSASDVYVQAAIGLAGVHKYEAGGPELGTPRDEAGTPRAIALGPSDELFVVDGEGPTHHVLEYDAAGNQSESFDAGNPGGERGIAYSEKLKVLYLSNRDSVRILAPPPPGPLLLPESQSASEVGPSGATLSASINPEGEATEYHFEYGTSEAYGQSSASEELKGGPFEDQQASSAISGLQPSTTYHYRVVAHNALGALEGPDATFTTLPPVSIDGLAAFAVDDESARLRVELNPHGLPSEYRFEYDTAPFLEGQGAHGTKIPVPDEAIGASSSDVTRNVLIQGLSPATTYHYRVVAHNALGNVESADHSFITQTGLASLLPDGRAWELVSPVNKHGGPLEPITNEGGAIQAASGGGAITYIATGPIGEEVEGVRSPADEQLISRRGPGGWSTQEITTPREELTQYQFPAEYKLFSSDLSAGLVEPAGATPLSPQATERTPYRREADGEFVPLVTAANVPESVKFGGELEEGVKGKQWAGGVGFDTATPDGAHVLLSSPQPLAPGFQQGFEANGRPNLYELSGGQLQLVSVLPSREAAAEAGLDAKVAGNMRGALSRDGQRVVFETVGARGRQLYLRDTSLAQTVRIDAGGSEPPVLQGASSDADKIFFTDASRLTPDATAMHGEPDLYMCEVRVSAGQLSCKLHDLTLDVNPGEAANVQGEQLVGEASAIDASGEHVYFAAEGRLTSAANARGEHAVAGNCVERTESASSSESASCNLYVRDTASERTELVAVLSGRDAPDWEGQSTVGLSRLTARSSPSGRYFAFMSQRSLSGYDNRDAGSGQRDEEVFLYDSQTGGLACASCNPTGARPEGVVGISHRPGLLLVDNPATWARGTEAESTWLAGSIPGWTSITLTSALYQSRYLADSGRLFFNAADALVPQDTNGVEDVYQYEPPGVGDCSESSSTISRASGGCVNLISSGSSPEESAFLDASEDGNEVFFLTAARLSGTADVDSAFDVYDAHVCSISSPCPPPPPAPPSACEGDACQSPSAPPGEITPGSLIYHGPGNASPPSAAAPKKPTRAQLLARALRQCKKHKAKRKRVACERRARKIYGAKPAKAKHKKKGGKSSRRAAKYRGKA